MSSQTPESINIVALIEKDTSIRLIRSYQSELLKKIQNTFDAEEQQLFVASFYCYLKYDSKRDFIINFEDVWKWCGFSRKSDAKKLLEKFFTKDNDYNVEKAAAAIAAASLNPPYTQKYPPTGCAGLNKEHILLTVNCFKKFCMKAGTKKADQIHDYYIKLEELLQKLKLFL